MISLGRSATGAPRPAGTRSVRPAGLRAEEISRKLALKGMPGALEGARAIQ
ncbi:phosphatase, partial [Pseudomonas sp. FSL R10-0071]|nr:phosphatase [Pseudomonas sp. FSL R10-0071]